MKIRFKARISGYAKVAYSMKELEVDSYVVKYPGDSYISPADGKKYKLYCQVLITGKHVYEMEMGTTVREKAPEVLAERMMREGYNGI